MAFISERIKEEDKKYFNSIGFTLRKKKQSGGMGEQNKKNMKNIQDNGYRIKKY